MKLALAPGATLLGLLISGAALAQPADLPEPAETAPEPPSPAEAPPADAPPQDPPPADPPPQDPPPQDPPPAPPQPVAPPPAPAVATPPPAPAPLPAPPAPPRDLGGAPPPPPPPGYYDIPADDVEEEPTIRNGFSARVGLGPAYRNINGHDVWGVRFNAALGAQFKDFGAIHGDFGYSVGRTDGGLKTETFTFGPTWEFIIDRFRVGLGAQYTMIWMQRVTIRESMFGGGGGVNGFLSFDLIQGEHANLQLGLDGRYNWLDYGLGYGGLGLALGGRFKTP